MPLGRLSPLRGFLVAAIILIALGVYVVASAIRFGSDYRWVDHSHGVIGQLGQIEALKYQAVSETRGYILGGREESRDNFWKANGQLQRALAVLAESVADNPPQRQRAADLRQALERRLALSAESIESYRSRGQTATVRDAPAATIRGVDANVMRRLEQMRQEELSLLGKRKEKAEDSAWLVLLAAGMGIPLSLIILGHTYRMLIRENRIRTQAETEASASNAALNKTVSQLERLSDSMSALSNYSGMLQGASDAQELFEITQTTFRKLMPGVSGFIYVIRASRDQAELMAQWGESLAPSDPTPSPQTCWSVRRNAPFPIEDMRNGLRCPHIGRPAGAAEVHGLCIPLSAQGEVMGWISLQAVGHGRLPGDSLSINLCEQLSLALANVRLKESLQHQAIRDSLTGLFNRRYLEESLSREIARCQRRQQPLAVLMLDMDHFKAFNDRHGHAMGDMALAAFGALLQAKCRPEDIACRYGGEEFTLILPETNLETALQRAEEIRASAALLRIGEKDSLPRITVSIGVALMPEHGDIGLELMRAGDMALYRAKHEGRDRVVVADQSRPS